MEYISAKIIVTKTKNLWKSIGMSKSKKSVEDMYREMSELWTIIRDERYYPGKNAGY